MHRFSLSMLDPLITGCTFSLIDMRKYFNSKNFSHSAGVLNLASGLALRLIRLFILDSIFPAKRSGDFNPARAQEQNEV
jgi:hypothetical protein